MKLHRYYVSDMVLEHDFWMKDEALFHQWTIVLRYQVDRELVLFNNQKDEKLYKIVKIGDNAVHLELVTEMVAKTPEKELYLCFSLLKKDKNDWILQKGTELGVRHFIPLLATNCERSNLSQNMVERWQKIVIEAAEQCERSDIPKIREPMRSESVINELSGKVDLYVAEQGSPQISDIKYQNSQPIAVLIGPEGGWSDAEKQLFTDNGLNHISLSEFTLRAETAAITAAALIGAMK